MLLGRRDPRDGEVCRAPDGSLLHTENVELTGGEPNAYDSVGNTYMWHGRYAEAEAAYREALRRDACPTFVS